MTSRILKALAALALPAALAACGGGSDSTVSTAAPAATDPGSTGGSSSAASNMIPQSALQSSAALVAYVKSLVASPSETAAPVGLGDQPLPTDETGPSAAL